MSGGQSAVLVVDDEPSICDLYADHLRDEYDVTTATSGEAALEALGDDVDVVLLDRRMPDLRGEAVLERIRDWGLQCRVALVTAVEPSFDIVDMGFDRYLCKPVSKGALRETVSTLETRNRYDARLGRYCALLAKQALLRRQKTESELAASEAYERLQSQIDALREETARIATEFDAEDFRVAFRDLDGAAGADGRENVSQRN